MQSRLAFLCVLQIALSTSAFTQDVVTDCDRYAASDTDTQRKATGVPFNKVNSALAVPACEAAVRQFANSPRLILQLGRAYYQANNFSAALDQFRKAAEQNYADAQGTLGFMYSEGKGVFHDDVQALAWFRKAADYNNPAAQASLGVLYENGRGVAQDYKQAVAWYRKSAEQGFAAGQNNLAGMYFRGLGVRRDYAEAVAWYRQAANQGWPDAIRNLRIALQKQRCAEPLGSFPIALSSCSANQKWRRHSRKCLHRFGTRKARWTVGSNN